MSAITITHTYAQSPAAVFTALNDFPGIHRFHPMVKSSPQVEGTPVCGAGSERVCHLYDGNTLHERMIEVEDDRLLSVEVLSTSMPMKRMVGRYELAQTSSGGTEVTMSVDFELKMGLLGKVLDKLVMGKMLRENLALQLAALGEHLNTGEQIAKGWKPAA